MHIRAILNFNATAGLIVLLLCTSAYAYVDRVAVVGARVELIEALSWASGNHFKFVSVTADQLATDSGLYDTEQVILVVDVNSDIQSLIAQARQLPEVDLIHLLPRPNTDEAFLQRLIGMMPEFDIREKSNDGKTLPARVVLLDPRNPDGIAGPPNAAMARLGRNGVTIPWVGRLLAYHPERLGNKDGIEVLPFAHGATLLRDVREGLQVIEPMHPRAGRHWFAINAPGGFANEALSPWVSLLLHRGYYLVALDIPPDVASDPSKFRPRVNRTFQRLKTAGLAEKGAALSVGDRMEPLLEMVAVVPWFWHELIIVSPPRELSGSIPGFLTTLAQVRESGQKSLFFITDIDLTPDESSWLWHARVEWEQAPHDLVTLSPGKDKPDFLRIANTALRDGGAMASSVINTSGDTTYLMEAYAHREPVVPAFSRLSAAEMIQRFRATEGKIDGPLNPKPAPKQQFFGNDRFEGMRHRWRDVLGLKRHDDGTLTGPRVLMEPDRSAPEGTTVTIDELTHGLGALCRAWWSAARTEEDRDNAEPLIRDMGLLLAQTIRQNFNRDLQHKDAQKKRKTLSAAFASVASGAHLMDTDAAEEIGRFVFDGIKDRWALEPYQNMDIFRATAANLSVLSFFRDDATLYRFVQERADYVDRVMRLSSAISQEGGPRHHGLMHYSYASYSFWAVERLINRSYVLGNYLSRDAYDRYSRTGIVATSLVMPRYYGGILPYNVNARTAAALGVGRAGLPALETSATKGNEKEPQGWNLEALAYIDWAAPGHKVVQQARREGVDWSSIHPRLQRTVNTGTFAIRQFGEMQASAVGMSRHLGSWVEVYFPKSGEGFGLYHKAGSLLLRSPDSLNAERFVVDRGFDHSRIPGATSETRAGDEMRLRGTTGKIVNDRGIGGGVHLPAADPDASATDGMLAVDLDRGPGPGCYKSYFFFGDRITSITSNIEKAGPDAKHVRGHAFIRQVSVEERADRPILTTLFQWPLDATKEDATRRNEDASKQLTVPWLDDTVSTRSMNNFVTRRDQFGNAWVIHPARNATLHYRRSVQEYEFFSDHKTGRWETSWIEHQEPDGSDDASLVYTVVPRTTDTDAEDLVASLRSDHPAYEVWRSDAIAHIVHDAESSSTGYAIFHPTPNPARDSYLPPSVTPDPQGKPFVLSDKGKLVSASAPAMAMIRDNKDGSRTLSYFNPIPTKTRRVILTLRGRWKVADAYRESDPDSNFETLVRSNGTTEIHFVASPTRRNGNDNRLPVMVRLVDGDELATP